MALSATAMDASILQKRAAVPDYTTSEAGNPFVDGWYADPGTAYRDGQYWVYAAPALTAKESEQTSLDAFSSPDLVHWSFHGSVLNATANFGWATHAVRGPSPAVISSDGGYYYLYFSANNISETHAGVGGIGVGMAKSPEGPYFDPIGAPLVGAYHRGAPPVDCHVFVDDNDGDYGSGPQAYLYYGWHGHLNVAKLNADMISIGLLDDGSQFQEITPAGAKGCAVQGKSHVFKRAGVYYLMWSSGRQGGNDNDGHGNCAPAISYATSSSPLGPFLPVAGNSTVLQLDPAVAAVTSTAAIGSSTINVPGTDIWYLVYNRQPLSKQGAAPGTNTVLAYDRLYFSTRAKGSTIEPVQMLTQDNFADGDMVGWTAYDDDNGSSFIPSGGQLAAGWSWGGKALLDVNFTDLALTADVSAPFLATFPSMENNAVASNRQHLVLGDAGLVFRVAPPITSGVDSYRGYYAGIRATGNGAEVILGRADGGRWTQLATTRLQALAGSGSGRYRMRVKAVGDNIQVFVGDDNSDLAHEKPQINVADGSYASGRAGVRVYLTSAVFGNVSLARP
ncbi:putative glycosyl hydrolase [Lasiosphaeria ovina]|uniref:Glycosyl hydrolase n=1 Tax=Lasiosphaeria ovina TaxID=92902 RepID=A0AAE0N899_9PEZI|nr:putative glycosyl hydrolase [Lasiosphaeria ovina]